MHRLRPISPLLFLFAILVVSGCSGSDDEPASDQAAAQQDAALHLSTSGFQIDSPKFQEKVRPFVRIPKENTCVEDNLSPPLTWTGAPEATQSFALVTEDIDHETGIWVHWVIYNIPAGATELPEGISTSTEVLPDGTAQGINDEDQIGYYGPCPPPNVILLFSRSREAFGPPHRYFFRLYALDSQLSLAPGATKDELANAMEGHILGQANTMGKFTRPLTLQSQVEGRRPTATRGPGATPTSTP